jgi:glycosyltransferase involved in cell wall biosynthesis
MIARPPGVVLDLQGAQDPMGAERGIGRYLRELANALSGLPSRYLSCVVANADEPVPGSLKPLLESQPFATQETVDDVPWDAYHVGSLFDVEKPLGRVVPPRALRPDKRLIVTLYDLIPLLFPTDYLGDAVAEARYTARLQLLRQADCILAISESTAADAVEHVGVDRARVHVVGAGVASQFRPPPEPDAVWPRLRRAFPDLRDEFILVTGAGDRRKNHRGLLEAYARLPDELRHTHQLVVAGSLSPDELRPLERLAARLRIRERLHFTGFIDDERLLLLYQACALFVFPSYYEGFGLPVVEALAAGAPVLASDSSSLREIVRDPAARFDPRSASSMCEHIGRALADPAHRNSLRRPEVADHWSWPAVADRVEEAYAHVLGRTRVRRRRHRVAWISPLPPQRSRAAALSARVLHRCPTGILVDAYRSGPPWPEPARAPIECRPTQSFEHVERLLGSYDAVVYCLDGRPYSADALWLLRNRPGIVIALDLRLATVYQWRARNRPDPDRPSLVELCESQYGAPAAAQLERLADPTLGDLDRIGVLMSREAIESSTATIVQSDWAQDLARLEAPLAATRVETFPWALPAPAEVRPSVRGPAVVTAFGWIDPSRQPEKLVAALPAILRDDPDATVAFVGPIDARLARALERQAGELGARHALTITGAIDDRGYSSWLGRTTVAVQLREVSNGESSSTIGECLAHGVPTIATAIGATLELPDGCMQRVGVDLTADELAAEISAVIHDQSRRSDLSEAGRAFASEADEESFAELLWDRVLA